MEKEAKKQTELDLMKVLEIVQNIHKKETFEIKTHKGDNGIDQIAISLENHSITMTKLKEIEKIAGTISISDNSIYIWPNYSK